jgi:hypothetical protein
MMVYPETSQEKEANSSSPAKEDVAPSTPKRTRGTSKPLGTIETPAGRRSARIATRRKED